MFLFISLLNSCEPKKVNASLEKDQKDISQKKRIEAIMEIAEKYNANAAFDTVRYNLTYQYQKMLDQNKIVIIDRFKIIDIKKIDSNYIVSIEKGPVRKFFVDLTCSESQISSLYPDLSLSKNNTVINNLFLIVRIDAIKKMKFSFDTYGNENTEDDPNIYSKIESSDVFLGKGKLIDIYIKND